MIVWEIDGGFCYAQCGTKENATRIRREMKHIDGSKIRQEKSSLLCWFCDPYVNQGQDFVTCGDAASIQDRIARELIGLGFGVVIVPAEIDFAVNESAD